MCVRGNGRVTSAPWAALLAAVTMLGGCGAGGSGVASVDGHPIALATFRHWLTIVAAEAGEGLSGLPEPPRYAGCIRRARSEGAKGVTKPSASALRANCASRYRTLTRATLGFLIPAEWLLAEARDLGISVPDARVKREFVAFERRRFPRRAEFETFRATSGYTVSDLLLRVKLDLLSAAIRRRVVDEHSTVSDAQVERYYRENQARFGTPEKRAVFVVLTKTERAAKLARHEIESGTSFSTVARKVSIDPSGKADGGLIPAVVRGQYPKALDDVIFSARANVLEGPVKTSFGYYLLSVKSVTRASVPSLSKVKNQAKSELAFEDESQALNSFIKAFRTRWTRATNCDGGYVVMQCSEYRGSRTE